jgi:hypothetical protein
MSEPTDAYDRYMLAIGRLCAAWAILDREINALLKELLKISDAQVACLATEMNDVAPRCRLLKTLSYTVPAPTQWKEAMSNLSGVIMNHISPQRNRYVHDYFSISDDALIKFDRRVKLSKISSFSDLTLHFDITESVTAEMVELVTIKAMSSAANLASARFDLEFLSEIGSFPEAPQLSGERVSKTTQFRWPPDD